ncbi:MAG TPA: DUF6064 family protein [Anaeromyxobacteraceae bacterium]|nr:DUF6064 family protein [Anaeromyxobacteraceae bacterium]
MGIPFTVEAFFQVFERYNLAIWPAQVVAWLLGAAALLLALRRTGSGAVAAVLASFWIVNGAGYHLLFFRTVNPAAGPAGVVFVLQGLLFLLAAARRRLSFGAGGDRYAWLGLSFAGYAMVAYPLLGALAGHRFPRSPAFGVAPCPTTIFTFGMLLLTDRPVPRWLLPIPFLWSLVGLSAAAQLGVLEDYGLPVAGILGTGALLVRDWGKGTRAGVEGQVDPG